MENTKMVRESILDRDTAAAKTAVLDPSDKRSSKLESFNAGGEKNITPTASEAGALAGDKTNLNGYRKVTWDDGAVYEGEFVNSLLEGEVVTFLYRELISGQMEMYT